MSNYYILINDTTRKSVFCIEGQDPLFLGEHFYSKITELNNIVRKHPEAANNKEVNKLINTSWVLLKEFAAEIKKIKGEIKNYLD